jgi:hypothetical protein
MIKKTLEKKLLLDNSSGIPLESPVELEYYLVESYSDNLSLNEGSKVYGLGISRKMGENCFEEKVVRNFSTCIDETKTTLDVLASNSVTPESLLHVLDDMLGSL